MTDTLSPPAALYRRDTVERLLAQARYHTTRTLRRAKPVPPPSPGLYSFVEKEIADDTRRRP